LERFRTVTVSGEREETICEKNLDFDEHGEINNYNYRKRKTSTREQE
jgi:hypothetical protein